MEMKCCAVFLLLVLCVIPSQATTLVGLQTKARFGIGIAICIECEFGRAVDITGVTEAGYYKLDKPVCLGTAGASSRAFSCTITLKIKFSFRSAKQSLKPGVRGAAVSEYVIPVSKKGDVLEVPDADWIKLVLKDSSSCPKGPKAITAKQSSPPKSVSVVSAGL